MANLRKKLDDPAAPQLLLTEPGMGYRFVPEPEPPRRRRPDRCGWWSSAAAGQGRPGRRAGRAGDVVAVVDKDPKAFERLGEEFTGQTVEGIGFDRDVLEQVGVARPTPWSR